MGWARESDGGKRGGSEGGGGNGRGESEGVGVGEERVRGGERRGRGWVGEERGVEGEFFCIFNFRLPIATD